MIEAEWWDYDSPEELAEALRVDVDPDACTSSRIPHESGQSCWWTEGSAGRAAWAFSSPGMPDDPTFARMLDQRPSGNGQ